MNFDLSGLNPVYTSKAPVIGNVYTARGGRASSTKFWVVIAVRGDSCKLLGIDSDGDITGGQSYYTTVVGKMPLIGRCRGVMDLDLKIEGV